MSMDFGSFGRFGESIKYHYAAALLTEPLQKRTSRHLSS